MRISFDLDDTLILGKDNSHKDNKRKLLNGEYLRTGAIELLKALSEQHEILIYTTSYRSPFWLKVAFWFKGIKIKTVINNSAHTNAIQSYNFDYLPSKYPPHFDIAIHVDDSLGVVEEGKKFGFEVIHISPSEKSWSNKILETIEKL